MSWTLAEVRGPTGWSRRPFGRLVDRVQDSGRPDLQSLSVFLDDGVVPRSERTDNYNRLGENLSRYLVVRPGDLVFNKLRTWQGGLGVSRHEGIVSPAYFVCRPGSEIEPRFLHYALRSPQYLAELTRVSKWMPPAQFDIAWEDLRGVPVTYPAVREQRAIADFLDAETARIDALIAKKRRMVHLLDEQEQRALLDAVGDWRNGDSRTLRQFGTKVLTGPFGTVLSASEYVRDGVPLINPTHIRNGRLVPEPEVSVPVTVADRISRHRLHHGDLVMGRKGDVGRSALVPAEADGWLCGSDSIAIRCDANRLLADFLAQVLHVELYRQQLAKHSTGATLANVNESVLMSLKLPGLSVPQQAKAIAAGTRVSSARHVLVGKLVRQIELLQEHRHALITAAVTGKLDIPGVAA